MDDAIAQIGASDREVVAAGIQALGTTHDARAARALGDRIAQGLPPPLLDRAVAAVIRVGGPAAHRVLYTLCVHRRPAVRAAALAGLIRTRAPRAESLVVGLLDDPASAVRSAAVAALDELGPSGALDELLAAARQGQPEAAGLLGRRAARADVHRLLSRLAAGDERHLAEAIGPWLTRDDLPERTRVMVAARLASLGPGGRALLRRMIAPLAGGDAVRVAAEEAIAEAEAGS